MYFLYHTLIETLVIPHFEYGDLLFTDLKTNLSDRLQHADNACIQYINNIRVSPSSRALSWLRLNDRRTAHSHALGKGIPITNHEGPRGMWMQGPTYSKPRY